MNRWLKEFIKRNKKDIDGAKFNIGESVSISHNGVKYTGVILAVNKPAGTFEYAIEGIEFLVWEFEITLL